MPQKFEKKINRLFIDPIIFTEKFVQCCDANVCFGECCYYGVYADYKEYEAILQMKDKIIKMMDDSQTKDVSNWFEKPEKDNDFESGIAIGTEIYNGKCVFLDKLGFCTLQKIAMDETENWWKYKPLYCILFPLVICEGALTIDDGHMNSMHYCSKMENQSSTIYDSCKEEIKYLLGEEGFKEIEKYRIEFLTKQNKGGKS